MAPLTLLHVIGSHYVSGPGSPAVELAWRIKRRGHKVIFCCIPGGSLEQRARETGVVPLRLPHLERTGSVLMLPGLVRELRHVIKQRRVDLVHVHRSAEHLASWLALRNMTPPPTLVRTWHAGERGKLGSGGALLFRLSRAHIVTVSEESREEVAAHVASEYVHLVHGGVDTERFRPEVDGGTVRRDLGIPEDAVVIGMVSKFSPERKTGTFLKAFARLAVSNRNIYALLVSDGTRACDPAKEAKKLGIEERTRVITKAKKFVETVATIDIGVQLKSGTDGSCRATMEMMSMGKAVVVADRGVLPELAGDGVTGRVVGGESAEELARTIASLVSHPAERRRLGEAARASIERNFTLERTASSYEALYQRLLGQ